MTVSFEGQDQTQSVIVLHPSLQLAVDRAQLRRLTADGCSPPVYESAQLHATASFPDPDLPQQHMDVDITTIADFLLRPDDGTLNVQQGVVQASTAIDDATISLQGAPVGAQNASVVLSAVNAQTCVDALVPVPVTQARIDQTVGAEGDGADRFAAIRLRLTVNQYFSDPGDTGMVPIYAAKGLTYTDVTTQV